MATTSRPRTSSIGLSSINRVGGAGRRYAPPIRSRDDARRHASEAGHLDRVEVVGGLEPEDLAEERQLGLERSTDRGGAAEPVPLALEREVGVRDAVRRQRRHDRLRLGRRDDLVVEALHDQHRAGDLVEEMDRRTLAIQLRRLRVRTHESVEVARLELVRVARHRLEIAHAEQR